MTLSAPITNLSGLLELTFIDFISAKFLETVNGSAPSLNKDALTSSSSTFDTITSHLTLFLSNIFFLTPLLRLKLFSFMFFNFYYL